MEKYEWEILVWDLQKQQTIQPAYTVAANMIALEFDREGQLWIAAQQQGIITPVRAVP